MGLEASMIEFPTRDRSLLALTGGRSDIDCVGTLMPGSILFDKLLSLAKFGLCSVAAIEDENLRGCNGPISDRHGHPLGAHSGHHHDERSAYAVTMVCRYSWK